MSKRMIDTVPTPTQEQIDKLAEGVAGIAKEIEPFAVALSKDDRRAATKMRVGGENIIATVGQLAAHHNLNLPGFEVAAMNDNLALAQRLRPLADAVQQLDRTLTDTMIAAHSDAWKAACALYNGLTRSARENPAIEAALRPVAAFFATGARKKASPETPPEVPGVPPTKSVA